MSSKRISVMALVMVLTAALVIAAVLLITGLNRRTESVSLPPEHAVTTQELAENADASPRGALPSVAVSPETVRRVIATLSRSTEYSRRITSVVYWSDGSSRTEMSVHVSGEDTALTISGTRTKHVLIVDDVLYIWYEGDAEYYSGDSAGDALRLADEYQMLVTWEDIVSLPDGAITDAGYEEYEGENCIYVRYTSGRLGYVTTCRISMLSGLVIQAEICDGDTPIYDMTASDLRLDPVPDSVFDLPDGSNARSVSSDTQETQG